MKRRFILMFLWGVNYITGIKKNPDEQFRILSTPVTPEGLEPSAR
jgi:hypothetical protein